MDYKDPERWAEALPNLPFPENDGEKQQYIAFGIKISASDLGNINFGIVGRTLQISENLLLQQAGSANLRDHRGQGMLESQWNSFGAKNYGDEEDDYIKIQQGFEIYDTMRESIEESIQESIRNSLWPF